MTTRCNWGRGYFDRNRTGDVVLTLVEGIEKLETFFGQYLSQILVSAIGAGRHLRVHGYAGRSHRGHIPGFRGAYADRSGDVPQLEPD